MRFSAKAAILVTLAAFRLAQAPALAREGRRIFISVDMEGIGGVVAARSSPRRPSTTPASAS